MSSEASGGKDSSGDLLDLSFDPTGLPPPLRPPALSQAQLLAAIQLGFSNKYLPTEVTGRVNGNSGGEVNYQQQQNNYIRSNPNVSGGQGQRYQGSGQEYLGDFNNQPQYHQQQNRRGNGQQEYFGQQNQEEGLLAPLRRPHVNEIPPDVLAVLLKTARFDEILGAQQRHQSQGQPVNNTTGNQDHHYQNQDYSRMADRNQQHDLTSQQQERQGNPQQPQRPSSQQQPRRQNQGSPLSQHGYSSPSNQTRQESGSGDWNQSKKTTLSPFAKEFQPTMAPRTQCHVPPPCPDLGMNYSQDEANLAEALAQIQMMTPTEFADGPYSGQSSLNEDNADCVLTVVTDSINEMTHNPANFQRCAKAIHEVLKNHVTDTETLGVVVTLIIEQSISNPNFCYSGARLAQYLNKKGDVTVGTSNFKNQLLTRLQDEFTSCVNIMEGNPDIIPRCRGILSFFGELYMNWRIVKRDTEIPFDVIGLGVSEMMQKLVKEPTHDNIKCVFQVAKLVGWEIENHGSAKLQGEFSTVLKELSFLNVAVTVKPQTKLLLDTLFELIKKNWNRGTAEEEAQSSTASTASNPALKGTEVFELPESDEDDFDDTCLMIDDESEEVQKAYDEFLKMSQK